MGKLIYKKTENTAGYGFGSDVVTDGNILVIGSPFFNDDGKIFVYNIQTGELLKEITEDGFNHMFGRGLGEFLSMNDTYFASNVMDRVTSTADGYKWGATHIYRNDDLSHVAKVVPQISGGFNTLGGSFAIQKKVYNNRILVRENRDMPIVMVLDFNGNVLHEIDPSGKTGGFGFDVICEDKIVITEYSVSVGVSKVYVFDNIYNFEYSILLDEGGYDSKVDCRGDILYLSYLKDGKTHVKKYKLSDGSLLNYITVPKNVINRVISNDIVYGSTYSSYPSVATFTSYHINGDTITYSVVEGDSNFHVLENYNNYLIAFKNTGYNVLDNPTFYIFDLISFYPIKNVYVKANDDKVKFRYSHNSTIYDRSNFILTPIPPNSLNINTGNRGGVFNIIINFNIVDVYLNKIAVLFDLTYPSFPYNGQMNLRLFGYNDLIDFDGVLPCWTSYQPCTDYPFCGTYRWLSTSGDTDTFGLDLYHGSRLYNDTWWAGDWYGDLGEMHITELPNPNIGIMIGIEINDRDDYDLILSNLRIINRDTSEVLYQNNLQNFSYLYQDTYEENYGIIGASGWVKVKKNYIKDKVDVTELTNIKKVYLKGD